MNKNVILLIVCPVLGALIGYLLKICPAISWALTGALIGLALALIYLTKTAIAAALEKMWPDLRDFMMRHRLDEWRLVKVSLGTLEFTATASQRRVAWRLFMEITSRIATQEMDDEHGDDGLALKSLYELFQFTRKTLTEMDPTPVAIDATDPRPETLETYALEMLNLDLRPFLSRWHPSWDKFAKSNNPPDSQQWPAHAAFRADLRAVQRKVRQRAIGLGTLAGANNPARFFPAV